MRNLSTERAQTLSHVETGSGESTLTLGESTVKVDRESAVLVGGDAKSGVLLVLDRGGVTCDVAPRAGRPPFVVQAGNVRVRVVGTRFQVGRAGSNVTVHVDHGMVEVTADGRPRMLRDGESFNTTPGPEAANVPSPAVETAPAPVATDVEPTPAGSGPVAASARRPRATPNAKPSGIVRSPDFTEPVAPAAVSPRDDYERAARLERTDPEGASSIYRRLAAGTGTWSANALFALARLELSRGLRSDAKRHAEDYLARYPNGLNAADARDLLGKLR